MLPQSVIVVVVVKLMLDLFRNRYFSRERTLLK